MNCAQQNVWKRVNKSFVIDKTGIRVVWSTTNCTTNLQRWILWAGNVILLPIQQNYSAIHNYCILEFLCDVLLFCTSRPESVKGSLLRDGVWRNAPSDHTLTEEGQNIGEFCHHLLGTLGATSLISLALCALGKWSCTSTCMQTRP